MKHDRFPFKRYFKNDTQNKTQLMVHSLCADQGTWVPHPGSTKKGIPCSSPRAQGVKVGTAVMWCTSWVMKCCSNSKLLFNTIQYYSSQQASGLCIGWVEFSFLVTVSSGHAPAEIRSWSQPSTWVTWIPILRVIQRRGEAMTAASSKWSPKFALKKRTKKQIHQSCLGKYDPTCAVTVLLRVVLSCVGQAQSQGSMAHSAWFWVIWVRMLIVK